MAALAVVLGAFGAHWLKGVLTPERLATYETAVRYQMYAALGIQLAALARPRSQLGLKLLLVGASIFSGSLYLLCLTGQVWWGAVTPLGGLCMITAWVRIGWPTPKEDDYAAEPPQRPPWGQAVSDAETGGTNRQ